MILSTALLRCLPLLALLAVFFRPQCFEQEDYETVGIAPSGANLDTLVEDWLEPPILGSSDGLILEFVMHFHSVEALQAGSPTCPNRPKVLILQQSSALDSQTVDTSRTFQTPSYVRLLPSSPMASQALLPSLQEQIYRYNINN